jgi:hypothetical protein
MNVSVLHWLLTWVYRACRYYLSRGPLHCRRVPAKEVEAGIDIHRLLRDMVSRPYLPLTTLNYVYHMVPS